MERDPADVVKQDQSTRHEQFSKIVNIDPFLFMPFEVDPGFLEQVDRVGCVHVGAG